MKFVTLLLCTMVFTAAAGAVDGAGTLEVVITGFRNSDGKAGINVFSREKGFPEKHELADRYLFADIRDNACTAVFEGLPRGRYAVSVFHDENMNQKIDGNLIGMPKEGVAVSNNARPKFAPPGYKAAAFDLDSDRKTIEIGMHYYIKRNKEGSK
jgi:uncharacterized protein (DUF2141 family)